MDKVKDSYIAEQTGKIRDYGSSQIWAIKDNYIGQVIHLSPCQTHRATHLFTFPVVVCFIILPSRYRNILSPLVEVPSPEGSTYMRTCGSWEQSSMTSSHSEVSSFSSRCSVSEITEIARWTGCERITFSNGIVSTNSQNIN